MAKFCGLLCGGGKSRSDYDLVEYIQNGNDEHNDSLEKFLTPTKRQQSRVRLPIYFKSTTPFKAQTTVRQQVKAQNGDQHHRSVTFNLSANIYVCQQDSYSDDRSNDDFETFDDFQIRATSSIIENNKITFRSNTPNISKIDQRRGHSSIMTDDDDTTTTPQSHPYYSCDYDSTSSTSAVETDNVTQCGDNTLLEYGLVYVCIMEYKAKASGDLSIKYSDRVNILQDNGTDYVLGKNILTKQIGYFPRTSIQTVTKFLSNLIV